MKKVVLTMLMMLASYFITNAQDDNLYELTRTISTIDKYDATNTKTSVPVTSPFILQKGWLFTIDHEDLDNYYIKFINWKDNATRNTQYVETKTVVAGITTTVPIFFQIPKKEFADVQRIIDNPKYKFQVGTMVIPFKIRFGKEPETVNIDGTDYTHRRELDITSNINVGINLSIRRRIGGIHSNAYLSLLGGLNLGSIPVDSSTTKGLIKSNTNLGSLSPTTGVMFEYSGFQLGIIVGWDVLSGKVGRYWDYQQAPWLGLGMGYNIYSIGGDPKKQ